MSVRYRAPLSEKGKEYIDELEKREKEYAENMRMEKLAAIRKLALESWEGCHGCTEQDKNFYVTGFIAGYNSAKSD